MYLATVPGCCTRKAVGYAIGATARGTDSVMRGDRYGGPQVPVHDRRNDPPAPGRGCQYTSEQFSQHLGRYEIIASTGRTGVCWDNAWAESFNATLKNERVYQMVYPTRSKAIRDIASWIELEYNQKRLHSALGYRTPNEVEEEHRAVRQAA